MFYIFEMANNHMGDIDHAKEMIRQFSDIAKPYKNIFDFAMKFQFRDFKTYIHESFVDRMDHKYVKRFTETQLSEDQFTILKNFSEEHGFITICTAFDENSVDNIEKMGFDILKVASCSFTDWPLLNRIAKSSLPIILSTAGSTINDIDHVIGFLDHRQKNISIMHCVGEYPTQNPNLQLNQIDLLRERYTNIKVGYSTHEEPNNYDAIKLAIAKKISIAEKHIALNTENYKQNAYSVTPQQMNEWLKAAKEALEMCGCNNRTESSDKEKTDLLQFKRGAYAKRDIRAGETLSRDDFYFAWPNITNQVIANDCSKYNSFISSQHISARSPIMNSDVTISNNREDVWNIVQDIKGFLLNAGVPFCNKSDLEISHHYGIEKFYEYGLAMITAVNREYCKKIIIVLPGQKHPEQKHEKKEETFIISYGSVDLYLDGQKYTLNAGDVKTIERGVKHSFYSQNGCIIEEISSTHYQKDSIYTDEFINSNHNRKTLVKYWL